MRRLPAVLVAAALAAHAGAAWAQPTDAEVLFDQARTLMGEQRYEEAAKKLEQSQALDPGVGTLLNLADCYVHLGRTATAWSTYRTTASLAATQGQPAREALAQKKAEELKPKLVTLAIVVPPAARVSGLTVLRGGTTLKEALYDEAVPVDPGSIEVAATAPGMKPFHATAVVDEKTPHATLSIPPLEPDASTATAGPGTQNTAAAPPSDAEPASARESGSDGSTQRLVGFAVGGAGLVGIAVGAILYAGSQSTLNDANCPNNRCVIGVGDPDRFEEGRSQEKRSFAVLGIGAALGITGAVLVITAPSAHGKQTALVTAGPSFIGLRGAF